MCVTTKRTGDPVYDSFIRRSLGTLLPDCIKQLCETRPADPIEFISNALYKAVDSELYHREKEKYLNDCLRESALLEKEREKRKARMEMLLNAERENKELLRQAREDEFKALMDLAENAELYGISLSPSITRRMNAIKKEQQKELGSEKTLQIKMPPSQKDKGKQRSKWIEDEEQITTESGTVITVKTRKKVPVGDDDLEEGKTKTKGKKGDKHEMGSVFGDSEPDATVGTVTLTDRGIFTFESDAIGTVQPPDPLNRQLAPADNPDIWAKERFDCHTLYDHELYINCDAEGDRDINQHASPPRKVVREYLDSVSRASSSEEEKLRKSHDGHNRLSGRSPRHSKVENRQYSRQSGGALKSRQSEPDTGLDPDTSQGPDGSSDVGDTSPEL